MIVSESDRPALTELDERSLALCLGGTAVKLDSADKRADQRGGRATDGVTQKCLDWG